MTPSPWFDAFPKKATTLKPGDRVIAAVPNGKALNLYVGTLQSVEGDKATVQFGTKAMIERAPSSLLIPLPAGEVKSGDLAAGIQNASAKFEFGLAGEPSEGGRPGQVDLVYSTGLGDVSEMFCDAVFPLVSGTEPLAVVMFDHPGKRLSRGVVIAKADGKVLIKDSAREAMILDESAIKPFSMKQSYKVGDKVQAWSYGIGYKPGTVSAVETPDRTYMVKSVRVVDESEDKFFFTELAPE